MDFYKLYDLMERKSFDKFFCYSWERNEITDLVLRNAVEIAKQTEILVIIGYSFPFFNRTYDKLIFNEMTSLRKVYYQDPNPKIDILKNSILPFYKNDIQVINDEPSLSQFFLPHEI